MRNSNRPSLSDVLPHLSPEQRKGMLVNGRPVAEQAEQSERPKKPRRGAMNKTEKRYAEFLESLQRAGKVQWWAFEAVKLRLASGAWYTPDFLVVLSDGHIHAIEIKGFAREAAVIRFKVAREQYPWIKFRMLRWCGLGWRELIPNTGSERPTSSGRNASVWATTNMKGHLND